MDQVLQLLELVLRLLAGAADEDAQPRHDLEVIAVAPIARHARLHVAVVFTRTRDRLVRAEYDFGSLGRELPPIIRRACPHDECIALMRARHRAPPARL